MIKKKILLISLIALMFAMPVKIKAYEYSSGQSLASPGGPSGGGSCFTGVHGCDGGSFVECRVSAWLTYKEVGYGYELYDLNDNSISINEPLLAGVPFGAKIYEYRKVSWAASPGALYSYQCKEYYQSTCTSCGCSNYGGKTTCSCWEVSCQKERSVTVYCGRSDPPNCQVAANEMGYGMAKAAVDYGASFSLNADDPNDARCDEPEKYNEELAAEGVTCQNYKIETDTSEPVSGKYSNPVVKKIYYHMNGACVNVRTGKVRYLKKGEKCNNSEELYNANTDNNQNYEIYVPNKTGSNNHWHVFTPLNTKETKGYTLELTPNNATKQSGGICQSFIEKYKKDLEYMNIIKPVKGTFTGNIATDKRLVQSGCYTYMAINLKVLQKFYNEVYQDKNNSNLIGYDFYYRPIDVNNPFPNGISKDSYWKTWSETGKKDPDLTESYDDLTYVSYNIDLNKVREYNIDNLYSSWLKMDTDGTSEFIEKSGIITRNPEALKDEIYNLGCGPSNADWEECKR